MRRRKGLRATSGSACFASDLGFNRCHILGAGFGDMLSDNRGPAGTKAADDQSKDCAEDKHADS